MGFQNALLLSGLIGLMCLLTVCFISCAFGLVDVLTTKPVASYSLLIYDYLLLLGQEKTLIWPASWNFVKFLFMINRYIPLLNGSLLIYLNTNAQVIPFKTYSIIHEITGLLIYGGILVAEVIVLFRTWALFGCSRRVGLAMLVLGLSLTSAGVYFLFTAVRPATSAKTRCDFGRSEDFEDDAHLFIDYIFLIAHETILLGLTLYKCCQLLRRKKSTFILSLFRDGILYYIFMLTATIVNVCYIKIYGETGRFILFQHILHSVFATRILLNLRAAAQKDSEEIASSDLSDTVSNPRGFLSTIVIGVGTWIQMEDLPKLPR